MGGTAKTLAAVASAAALAVGSAACGDDDAGSGSSELASIVPADAPLYGESVVRPEGEERETIERVITAATGEEDAGAYVIEKLNEAAAEDDSELTYEADFEPWLGERAAFFFPDAEAVLDSGAGDELSGAECVPPDSSIDPDDALGEELGGTCGESSEQEFVGVILQSTDADAAREAIEKIAAEDSEFPSEEASYEGAEYLVDERGTAAGVVGDFVVGGSEEAFKAAVDTEAGGESLADSDEYADTLADVGEDPTASFYVDSPALIEATEKRGELDAATRALLDVSFGGVVSEAPVAFGAKIEADSVSTTSSVAAAPDVDLAQSALLEEAPADAWAVVGGRAFGERIANYVDAFQQSAPTEFETAAEEFSRQTGFELEDLYEPLGDAVVYVSGTNPLSVQGAAVIETSDAEASAGLLRSLGKLALRQGEQVTALDLPGLEDAVGFETPAEGAPESVFVYQVADRLVVAYGEDAAVAASGVEDAEALVETDGFAAASGALGDDFEVGAYVDTQPIAELVGSIPFSEGEITPEEVANGIDAFDYLIGGARVDGDRRIDRVVIGLSE